MPRIMAAVLMAFMLALSVAPARSSEAATADDMARFLAGLPPSSNSPLAAYTKDPAWQQHARYFDSIFAREESAQLSKVREFSKKYLTDQHDTMLYMFSGPDFLYATSFFPNASTYVLAGLEPVGDSCTKNTSQACGSCWSIAARPSFRTIAVSRLAISKQGNGGFRRLGIMLDPSPCSQTSTSLKWRSCLKVHIQSNSELDTDGARTSRTSSLHKRSHRQLAMQS